MSNLTKEVCACCSKNINIGQIVMECENCNEIIHGRCYKKAGYTVVNDNWLCCCCASNHTTRYNPFKILYDEADQPNCVSSETLQSLQNINNILNSCKSYEKAAFNELALNIAPEEKNSLLFSSYFLNIDGNLTNFDSFTAELHQLKHHFSVVGLAETNCDQNNKELDMI